MHGDGSPAPLSCSLCSRLSGWARISRLRPAESPVRTGVDVTADRLVDRPATAPPTTVAAIVPNGSPQSLELASKPAGAQLTITLQDKTTLTGTTPFSAQVPGGNITISLAKTGYNTTVRELALNSPQSITVWLDPEGLLYQSLVRFKCGPQPKQVVFAPTARSCGSRCSPATASRCSTRRRARSSTRSCSASTDP